ncbi:MAG: Rod shape-determining protein MreC [uncultured Campylobacterales bacterium]|uniref:Rod shape-determining protein MreC n=1 Tax=uncultured Campylobacterales bacterium TaxID=352960 RepID=A0A6S6SVG3_9BACT|nr:MAG: Rod shape-determining protein MreC [uncultured Campylobacterales bacterium]
MTKNKKSILLLVLLVLFFFFRNDIKSFLLEFSNGYKLSFSSFVDFVSYKKDKYFFQLDTIDELSKRNEVLEIKYHKYKELKEEVRKYENFGFSLEANVKPVKVLSYVSLKDLNKLWITKPTNITLDNEKIYGVIAGEFTYGTAKLEDNSLKLITNFDKECVYAVYIGEDKVPGIAFGSYDGMLIKFIPTWMSPKVGDEVFTSGLDNIFYRGTNVGIVKEVIKDEDYITVKVNVNKKNYITDILNMVI